MITAPGITIAMMRLPLRVGFVWSPPPVAWFYPPFFHVAGFLIKGLIVKFKGENMHYGKISNPKTKEAKLYNYMKAHKGEWISAWDLAVMIGYSTCLHTYISGVRAQLRCCETIPAPAQRNRLDGTIMNYYCYQVTV